MSHETLTYFQLQQRLRELRPSDSEDTNILSVVSQGVRLVFEAEGDPKEIRELRSEIRSLNSEVRDLEEGNSELENKIDKLKTELSKLKGTHP